MTCVVLKVRYISAENDEPFHTVSEAFNVRQMNSWEGPEVGGRSFGIPNASSYTASRTATGNRRGNVIAGK
jgi:hypothetical protein